MDIRSFFGAKKTDAKSKKPNAGTTSSSNKKSTATATTRAQSTADATTARVKPKFEMSNAPPKAPPSSSVTTAKRRRIRVMLESSEEEKDDDSDTTICSVEETINKKKYAKKQSVKKQTAKKRSTEVDVDDACSVRLCWMRSPVLHYYYCPIAFFGQGDCHGNALVLSPHGDVAFHV